jgi:endonuclease/exonuclease/phosphatase family metal-dependent hydrolase
LLRSPRLGEDPKPVADEAAERLSADDTAWFGMRVDYVLPSAGIGVEATGVKRAGSLGERGWPSDHFPVWADLVVPAPAEGEGTGEAGGETGGE